MFLRLYSTTTTRTALRRIRYEQQSLLGRFLFARNHSTDSQQTVQQDHARCVDLVKARDREGYRKFVFLYYLVGHL
jgi:DNA-binding FadR family transcriptional regulator